jgi:hypothetical protein
MAGETPNPFVSTLSMEKFTPDPRRINEAMWGNPEGLDSLNQKHQQSELDKALALLKNDKKLQSGGSNAGAARAGS